MKYIYTFILASLVFSTSAYPQSSKKKQPNIVWIVCEDLSPHLGCYGDQVTKTPNLDQLATQGVRYTNAYTTAGVCAPSRNAIITGRYQTANGAHHMRTLGISGVASDAYPKGHKSYSALLPLGVLGYPHYLRQAGYYCSNNSKEDYQFLGSPTMWDESSNKAHWKNRKDKNQPFFSIFNLNITHESLVWMRDKEPLLVDPKDVIVPPIYPDDSISRQVIARFLTNAMIMDKQVGEIIKELKEANLYDDTVIFFYSDHGDGLPYYKRELHHRGLHIPLIIKGPGLVPGTVDDQLISAIDFAPTLLSIAGCQVPKTMQGKAFLGNQKSKQKNKYIFGARDRMDSEVDRVRSVFDGQYNYLKYYMPEKPFYQDIKFRLQNKLMPHMLKLRDNGQLNADQMRWFRQTKPEEELFDIKNDPFELKNLATDPAYAAKLNELRTAHEQWKKDYKDWGEMEEMAMVKQWWNGKETPPLTEPPMLIEKGNKIAITSKTKGASIGYRKSVKDTWTIYDKPIHLAKGDSLYFFAHRVGYTLAEKKIVR
jgi:N-sulfoglucosamine sulfohydrolase